MFQTSNFPNNTSQAQTETNRVYCLYRVSTDQQVDHDEANQADIPMQRKECHKFAERMGWNIIHEEQEEGISGHKVRASDRDKLQLIKDHAKQKRFDILLVFMFDRIGRIADETPFVVEWFARHGIQIWSAKEGEQRFDSHTDKLTNYIRFWQADGESEKTSIRTSTRMGQIIEEGHFTGGAVPYGYQAVELGRMNKKRQPLRDLVIDESEAPIVRVIFEKYVAEGYGAQRIAWYLNENGIKNRSGNNWHPASIRGMLKNITYLGILRSGASRSPVLPALQIIDEQTFEAAQKITSQRSNNYAETRSIPLNTRGRSLLAGNIFCGHCGGRLTITTNGKYIDSTGGTAAVKTRIRYVCCNKTRKLKPCDGQTGYTMHKLDDIINQVVLQIFERVQAIPRSEILSSACGVTIKERHAIAQRAQKEYVKAERNLSSLKQEVVKALSGQSAFSPGLLNELIQDTTKQCEELEAAYQSAQREAEDSKELMDRLSNQYDQYIEWSGIYDTASTEAKKMIVSQLIERVDVFKGYRLSIKFNISLQQFQLGLNVSA